MNQYPTLHLLKPEQLPRNRLEIIESCTPAISCAIASCTSILSSSSNAEALTQLSDTFGKISIYSTPAIENGSVVTLPAEHSQQEKFVSLVDDYMGVVRIAGDPLLVLLQSIFQAYRELLEEALMAGTSLEAQEWSKLRNAFESTLRYIAQEPVTQPPDLPLYLPTTHSESNNDRDPLRRWVLGHHVFYVLIQCLVVAVNCFRSAIDSENFQEAEAALALATTLMSGSTSALRFAGDFSVIGYQDVVRPSMMPPNAPPGLSGQFSGDHIYLVKILASLKPIFANLNPCLRPQHDRFAQALQGAYEAHKYVCSHFVGAEEASLRMNSNSKKTAVDVLEDLKKIRLRSVRPG